MMKKIYGQVKKNEGDFGNFLTYKSNLNPSKKLIDHTLLPLQLLLLNNFSLNA